MKERKGVLILALVLVLLIGGAAVLYNQLGDKFKGDQLNVLGSEEDDEEVGDKEESSGEETIEKNPAPDFTAYDAEGNPVKLSDYFGKPIVLNFWASWCGPCKSEMPEFNKKYLELKDEVVFLMVNMTDGQRETVSIAKEHVDTAQYSFPVLYDTAYEAANIYQVYSLPTTYFIDSEGNLVVGAKGAIDGATLQRGIDMIR